MAAKTPSSGSPHEPTATWLGLGTASPLAIGARLGQYELLGRIGRGGMGAVFRARHLHLKREVALKVLPPDRWNDAEAVARFQQEMVAIGKLDSPHVVRATDAGQAAGWHFLVMELVGGFDVGQVASLVGPLPVADACEIARQAALGLQYIHEHGLVHRDLKPSNLLLDRQGVVKILDLGLARLPQHADGAGGLTDSSVVMGTVDYMAPEQGLDFHEVDIRADLYSLGCTLYHLLAGQPPFAGTKYNSKFKKVLAHAQVPPPPLSTRRGGLPEGLLAVVDRLLSKQPRDRYAQPQVVAAALAQFCVGAHVVDLLSQAESGIGISPDDSADRGRRDPDRETVSQHLDATPATSPERVPWGSLSTRAWRTLRNSPRSFWAGIGAAGMCAVVLWAVASRGGLNSGARVPERGAPGLGTPMSGGARQPRHWEALLLNRPRELYFPPDVGSHWAHEPVLEHLQANVTGYGLLALGQVDSGGYRFRVKVTDDVPTANPHAMFGLFLGAHETELSGQRLTRMQIVYVTQFGDQPGTRKLARALYSVEPSTGFASLQDLATANIDEPGGDEHELAVSVTETGAMFVAWDGVERVELSGSPLVGRFITPEDSRGEFGLYAEGGAVEFRSAELLRIEAESDAEE